MTQTNLNVETFLRNYGWNYVGEKLLLDQVKSWHDLKFLGKNNIKELRKERQEDINDIRSKIREYENIIKLLKGKNGVDITKLANKYENPTFTSKDMAIYKGSKSWESKTEMEPVRPEDVTRQGDKTTFNVCGWCKYSMGCSRFSYMINGECMLLEHIGIKRSKKKLFYTKCELKEMTTQQIAEIVEKYEEEIKKLNIDLANLSYVVNHAKAIEELAETKPFLVDLRRSNHFNIGDKIIFFILDKEKEGSEPNILKRGFITGKVINGYRHHDGCVSAVADEKWHDGDYIQGRGTDWGASRGDFMLQSEFDYLMTHSDFLRLWLDTLYEFNSERGSYGSFKKAMLTQAK